MPSFSQTLADLERLESTWRTPREFFAARQPDYLATAASLARRVLMAAMPPDANAIEWRRKTDTVVARVTADLMLSGGILLGVSNPPDPEGNLEGDKTLRPLNQQVTHADVVEWIKAGERGDPGGKRITAQDREKIAAKGYDAVATVVMRAYYSRKSVSSYPRLRKAIQVYLTGAGEAAADPLLDQIAAAWEAHFEPRLARDRSKAVERDCKNF